MGVAISRGLAFVATAVDPTNPSRGLTVVVPSAGSLGYAPVFGPLPIAIDTSTGSPRVFMPRPGAGGTHCDCVLGDSGLGIASFTVDPQSLMLTHPTDSSR